MNFHIETYGCTANFGNSEEAKAALIEYGHQPSSLEDADIVIVNTCAVTAKTERKIKRRLQELDGDRLIVAGCLPASMPEAIRQIGCMKLIGLLNKKSAKEIGEILKVPPDRKSDVSAKAAQMSPVRRDVCGIVNISEGCNGGCTYCLVKKARGKLVSRRIEDVIDAAEKLVRSGAAEVQLAAQDTAAYGNDIDTNLAELLDKVTEIPGNFKVRIGMMNPDTALSIQKELIHSLKSPKIYRFLHMPVQSGSDKILKSMGRRYCANDFLEIVKDFRNIYPDLTLITDVIAGFPGETEEDAKETLDLIALLQPDKVNVTRFSRRPGTAAAKLYDMPDRIKKDRSRELTRLWLKIACIRNRRYIGHALDALVTECGRGETMKARSANYVGIVVSGAPELGSFCQIKIQGANSFYLFGILQ
jgi:threonylcarbamoyladenosine tRNA methylthiotransferase CDKAL1